MAQACVTLTMGTMLKIKQDLTWRSPARIYMQKEKHKLSTQ